MISKAKTPEQYIDELPHDRVEAVTKLRKVINANLPEGFKECMTYGMIGYVVPHEIYPAGYHCSPNLPLPFMSFASQKNSINFYHMGIYVKPELYNWFTKEYDNQYKVKLDIGKSCVRFKKMDQIPFDLIGDLVKKISVKEWIVTYETNFKR